MVLGGGMAAIGASAWRRARLVAMRASVAAAIVAVAAPAGADTVAPLPYPLVYVRAPYFGADAAGRNSVVARHRAAADSRPRRAARAALRPTARARCSSPSSATAPPSTPPPASRSSVGSVADPNVSFDGRWVLFTWYHDLTDGNPQRSAAAYSRAGADLYKLDLATRALVRLTHQELTPNTGNGARFDPGDPASNHPRIGVFNTGGTWAPGGRIVFTSIRNNFVPPKAFNCGQRVLQLFVMDDDGRNVEQIGHLNLGDGAPPAGAARRPHRLLELGGAGRARHAPVPALGDRSGRHAAGPASPASPSAPSSTTS